MAATPVPGALGQRASSAAGEGLQGPAADVGRVGLNVLLATGPRAQATYG
ncbi:MAG: hypothetical protein ACLGJB_23340 [Blastocatellia bacterium]